MKKREMLKYVLVGALVVVLLLSIYLGIRINDSLQACLEKNRRGSSHMAKWFHHCLGRATSVEYLLKTYREGLGETELNEDNVEAVVEGFFYEIRYSYWFLYGLRALNPELSEYEKPLYFIDRFVGNIFWWQSFGIGGRPTVRSVLDKLNVTEKVTAFIELNQTSFQKIDDLGREVAESFTWKGVNATRLDNTVNMVEELETVLGQWIDKYSAGHEINPSTDVVGQFQNVTIHEGDITIRNNATFLIENCQFNLTGRLTITDKALVRIKDARILLTCLTDRWNWMPEEISSTGPWRALMIIVEEQAKLEVDNATFVLSAPRLAPEIPRVFGVPYHGIYAKDFAEVNINYSKLLYADGMGDAIYAANSSRLRITNSDLSTHRYVERLKTMEPTPGSGIVSNDNSNVYVENSLLDITYFEDNSTVSLLNVNVTDWYSFGDRSPTINVTSSRIERIQAYCPANVYLTDVVADNLDARVNCSVWATKCTFGRVYAAFGADVWLFETKAQKMKTYNKGDIWIVYSLPLFGRITISYIYAPYIFPVIALVITSIVIVVSVFLVRRKRGVKSKLGLNASEA